MEKKKKIQFEILRFIVVGIIATGLDYVVHSLVAYFLPDIWPNGLVIALATTCGFIVSVIVNYLLSIVWVFQNVDQNINVSSNKNKFLFIALSAVGLFIGLGLMVGFEALSLKLWDINLNKWPDDFRVNYLKSITFWVFSLFFALKTLFVLSYNYLSRKLIIFKKPKEKTDEEN
ncbi:MAG: GtrA family protein [Bacilli bacterium]|jgi:putative flippase GtrA|nr:GtrA family protein [Bacilli bacterium]NLN80174.1 GtrA family protein [Erysipelotrichia bacterium]